MVRIGRKKLLKVGVFIVLVVVFLNKVLFLISLILFSQGLRL